MWQHRRGWGGNQMDIILIEGPGDSGKSTLARCLTGIGKANFQHPACVNVLLLDWQGQPNPKKTLVLPHSLNEGLTPVEALQHSEHSTSRLRKPVPPWRVGDLLNLYALHCGAEKAILCVSTTVLANNPQWSAQAFAGWLQNNGGSFGSHPVTRVVSLNNNPQNPWPLFAAAGQLNITTRVFPANIPGHAVVTRNGLASQVRPFINLV